MIDRMQRVMDTIFVAITLVYFTLVVISVVAVTLHFIL